MPMFDWSLSKPKKADGKEYANYYRVTSFSSEDVIFNNLRRPAMSKETVSFILQGFGQIDSQIWAITREEIPSCDGQDYESWIIKGSFERAGKTIQFKVDKKSDWMGFDM